MAKIKYAYVNIKNDVVSPFFDTKNRFFVDRSPCLAYHLFRDNCWAIVQLAGHRILAPIIKVRVFVAQPRIASPSSSRPRTPAFHAVNGGSNPPGDAKNFNRLQQLSFWVTKIGLQFFLRRPSLEEFLF